MMRARWIAAAALVAAQTAGAQTAALIGNVFRDTLGHELGGVNVQMPELKRSATANYLGSFKIDKLPAGRHAIVIRHVGFAPLHDTVEVADGAKIERDFVLRETAVELDSVRVTAASRKYLSPGLQEFEERRKQGHGHFISGEELRKQDSHLLIDVIIGKVPGLNRFRVNRTDATYISSMRKCGEGPTLLTCRPGQTNVCPPMMYLNGAVYYNASTSDATMIPDLRRIATDQIEGVEFYPGPATTPAKYNLSSNNCGVLLLWTRER